MIELDQSNYTKILNYFLNVMGYGYRCAKCDRRAKIISVAVDQFAFNYVNWECPKCMKHWGHEFHKKEIWKLLA